MMPWFGTEVLQATATHGCLRRSSKSHLSRTPQWHLATAIAAAVLDQRRPMNIMFLLCSVIMEDGCFCPRQVNQAPSRDGTGNT